MSGLILAVMLSAGAPAGGGAGQTPDGCISFACYSSSVDKPGSSIVSRPRRTEPMPDPKSPESYSLLTYAWVIGLALWGGAANYVRKLRAGHVRPFSIAEFIGEMVIAGFAGVITFWMCELSGTAPLLTAALVGISGHMGSRAIFQAEIFLRRRNGGGSE